VKFFVLPSALFDFDVIHTELRARMQAERPSKRRNTTCLTPGLATVTSSERIRFYTGSSMSHRRIHMRVDYLGGDQIEVSWGAIDRGLDSLDSPWLCECLLVKAAVGASVHKKSVADDQILQSCRYSRYSTSTQMLHRPYLRRILNIARAGSQEIRNRRQTSLDSFTWRI
jgi:hypothetical protein